MAPLIVCVPEGVTDCDGEGVPEVDAVKVCDPVDVDDMLTLAV